MAFEEIKQGVGGLGASSIQKVLEGIDYPADKQKLMQAARDHNAPESMLNTIQKMPDKQYTSPEDVTRTFGEMRK